MNDTKRKALESIIDKLESIKETLEIMSDDERGLLDEAANNLVGVISCIEDATE